MDTLRVETVGTVYVIWSMDSLRVEIVWTIYVTWSMDTLRVDGDSICNMVNGYAES